MATYFNKGPDEVLDYQFDWSSWLASGDTIETAVITAPELTIDSQATTSTVSTVWLSGGTAGVTSTVTCAITTAQGRTAQRSIAIVVDNR